MGTNKSETAACLVFQHRLSNNTPLISHNVLQSISSVCCSYFQFWNRTEERRGDRRGVWNKNTMLRQYPVFTLHPAYLPLDHLLLLERRMDESWWPLLTRVDINQVSRRGNTGTSVSQCLPPSQFNNSDWYELGMQGRGRVCRAGAVSLCIQDILLRHFITQTFISPGHCS